MATVELRNVSKEYAGGIRAVKGIDLEIGDEEFLVLVGPSGCGKSTTLRMIAGLETISDGEIFIDGEVVNNVAPKDRDIAMVFQNYALYPHMTVYKNLAFGLSLRGVPRREVDRRVREAAAILGIEDLLNRRPKALSGGQRQRVAVGRAIVRDPKVFLFDEPLSNLDAKLRVQMRAEISKLHKRLKTTMVYVTHDQVEAMTMGDRIVVMHEGNIQQVDTPLNLYQKPANTFVAGFIGSPSMNLIRGKLVVDGDSMRFEDASGKFVLEVPASRRESLAAFSDGEVILGLRPEELNYNTSGVPLPGRSIAIVVDVAEPMGAETFLYFSLGDQTLAARIAGNEIPETGAEVILDVSMEWVHFFDGQSEIRIPEQEPVALS